MSSINLESIFNDYLKFCKTEKISLNANELHRKINKAVDEAKVNYVKLTEPKTNSLDLYTAIWVKQSILYYLAKKAIVPVNLNAPPDLLKATCSFHLQFSKELQTKLKRKLFSVAPPKRDKVWKTFNLDLKEIESRFKDMAKERNEFAKNKGYLSRIDMALDWFNIPENDYKNFTKNVNRIIDLCNQQITKFDKLPSWFYSEFNIPCFICQISKLSLNSVNEVFYNVVSRYKILNKFRNKVDIKFGDKSAMLYRKETDDFDITIDKHGNLHHQITNLIHELSHVIVYLQNFKKEINPLGKEVYLREKEAIKIEMAILKKLSSNLYKAITFYETPLLFHRTLFEIELYKNPYQNLSQLYATIFNQCFMDANQGINPLYLLDERIVFDSFFTLPYAVAYANLLLDLENRK